MHALLNQWGRFLWWIDHLSAREAAVLGAVALATLTGAGKYFLVPLLSWTFKQLGKRLYPLLSSVFIFNRLVALPKYCVSIQTTVGRLRNPWLVEGQELKEIFVPISVSSGAGSSTKCDVRSLLQLLRAIVIVGDPGSGKSTALKAIAMNCLQQRRLRGSGLVPVYLELRAWGGAKTDLMTYVEGIFARNNFPKAGAYLKSLKRHGKLAFLLDGLDEVDDSNKPLIVDKIRTLLAEENREGGCPVYITSRPVGYDGQFSDLIQETAYMDEFTPAQIRQFVGNWDFRAPKSGAKLFQALVSRPSILLICKNPLMLTIVTSLYRETEYQLPDSRDAFYKVCIQALLTRWDAAREMESRNRYPEALKEAFLQDLSYSFLSDRGRDLRSASVLEQTEAFLTRRNRTQITADSFLHEIVRSGLLGKLPTGELIFAHKTFAEVLTAGRFRNKPEELMDLWAAAPETWLEVCSLYVSDSLTSVDEINAVLNSTIKRQAWQTALVLAGEAHTSSQEIRESLVRRLQADRSQWSTLDKRAIGALARFGNLSRSLLTQLMNESAVETRRLAVYALGQSTEAWATELLIAALTDPATSKSAAEALGGLGEDAVVLIEDLLRTQSGNIQLARACTEVAGVIGTAGALRAIIPLLWNDAARAAAYQIAHLLWLPEVRSELENSELALPRLPAAPKDDLETWAFPWLPKTADGLRTVYAKLSWVLIRAAKEDGQLLKVLPNDFLIPILVELLRVGHIPHEYNFPSSDNKVAEPAESSTATVVNELSKRPYEKNRALWSRVTAEDKKDILLNPQASLLLWALATLGLDATIVWGAKSHLLSWWWLLLAAPLVGWACGIAIWEKQAEFLSFLVIPTAAPRAILSWSKLDSTDRLYLSLFALHQTGLVACAFTSAWRLRGYWSAVILVLVPMAFGLDEDTETFRIVLYRRSNPLSRLRNLNAGERDQRFALPLRPDAKTPASQSASAT